MFLGLPYLFHALGPRAGHLACLNLASCSEGGSETLCQKGIPVDVGFKTSIAGCIWVHGVEADERIALRAPFMGRSVIMP